MEFVTTIFGTGLNVMVEPVKRKLGYLRYYANNVQQLGRLAEDIRVKRDSVRGRVQEAERNGDHIHDHVTDWLMKVNEKIAEIEAFRNDEGHMKTGCSNGSFPNLKLRYKLGKKAQKMIPDCDRLLQQSPNFDAISYHPEPTVSDVALHDNGYVAFKSRDGIMEEVMNALRDPTIKMIGICGQGGVGKTTLVKAIARKAEEENLFDCVVIATITSTPDVRRIQGEMAAMLGLRLDDETEIGRAGRLQQRLKKVKENILIILDDLWVALDLSMLGILLRDDNINPITAANMSLTNHDQLNDETKTGDSKRIKILLTSRKKEVLSTEMEVKGPILTVEVIDVEESKKLFNKVVGLTDEDSDLKSLSPGIVHRCQNLPLAIVEVSKALKKNKNKISWEDALKRLEKHEMAEELEPVVSSTMLSYDHLQSEELKFIFLLCACLGKDPSITFLVKYCIGLSVFQMVNTIKDVRDRTYESIRKLKESSLLLDANSPDCVTIHDMTRDAALSIARKQKNVYTRRFVKVDEWPHKDAFEKFTVISLHNCDIIDEIPEGINCPHLKVFHLDSKDPSIKIPDKLFEGMKELRVLILTGINLSSFPSSIKCLVKLRMLCLEQCVLGDNISLIGELKNLRVLSLSGSKFELLPSELRQLSKLQLFDISSCTQLKVIPSNLISNLKSLEELYMGKTLIQWGVERKIDHSKIATLDELRYLQQLRSLDIYIQDIATLPSSLSFDKLDSYKIMIGDSKMLLLEDFQVPRQFKALALHLKKGNIDSQMGIKLLFKKIEQLFLGKVYGLQNVTCQLNVEGFPTLKHLTVSENSDIQNIIYSTEWEHGATPFLKLESIYLYKLESLEKICNCQLTSPSFRSLKTMKIKICGRLKYLFSFVMARLLTKLETLEVSECDSLEHIVVAEKQENICDDAKISFPQLGHLTLQSILQLTCFYTNDMIDQTVANCIPLFDAKVLIPNLESLELSSINIKKVWGDRPLPSTSFRNLIKLNVNDCGGLKYLFSLSMVGDLMKLQSLSVKGCDMMKDIFDSEDISGNEENQDVDIFPQLKKIIITKMEELETIWHGQASINSFHSLEYVIINNCNKLVTIFPPHMVGRYHNLGTLEVYHCESVEQIFDFHQSSLQMGGGNETNLREVKLFWLPELKHVWSKYRQGLLNFEILQHVSVSSCPSLEYLFPLSIARNLEKLERFRVTYCLGMKEIVARDDASNCSDFLFEFPKLTTLELYDLRELRCFYEGTHAIELHALTSLALGDCDKLEAFATETTHSREKQFLSSLVKVMCKLEILAIYGLKAREWLWDTIHNNVYQMLNIKQLTFDGLSSTKILFRFLRRFPNLESLNLYSACIEEVLSDGCHDSLENIGTVIQLKEMTLSSSDIPLNVLFENGTILHSVDKLCIQACDTCLTTLIPSSVALTHLSYLEVSYCRRLRNLLTTSTGKSLVQLTTMKVTKCAMMQEIVTPEKNEEEKEDEIVFAKLKSLELVSLGNLTSFCNSQGKLVFRFPSLEKVKVSNCLRLEKFSKNIVSTPKLEQVYILKGEEADKWYWEGGLNATIQKLYKDKDVFEFGKHLELSVHLDLQQLWQGEISPLENCFNHVRRLTVEDCSFMSQVFPSRLLPYFKNLETLRVESSPVEVIFDMDGNSLTETNENPFNLERMTLFFLNNLKCIWSKDPRTTTSFRNLKELVVICCGDIKTLFPAYLARNLVRLKELRIECCDALEEIVVKEEAVADRASIKFEFRYLTTLQLRHLRRLVSFYSGNATLEFSALKKPIIEECPNMKCFSQGLVRAPNFVGIKDSMDKNDWHNYGDLNTTLQKLFYEKLLQFTRGVEVLKLGDCPRLKDIWHDVMAVPDEGFNKLKSLIVDGCQFLSHYVIPFHLLGFLSNLEYLGVRNCESEKAIFESGSLSSPFSIPLKTLDLEQLPGLENVWNEDPQEFLNFPSLQNVYVKECRCLKSLFPASMARGKLESLERLLVEGCEGLVEIVASQEATSEEASRNLIIFPGLTKLRLWKLSELSFICSGLNNVEWPNLKELDVYQCDQLKNIAIIMEPTITFEKVFPKLEHVSLSREDIMQNWRALFPAKFLQRTKSLTLQFFCDDSDSFPYGFFEKESLPHVEKLVVSCSNFKHMFTSERSDLNGHIDKLFSQLKTLQLISLSRVNSIGLEHTPLPGILETLEVASCPCLIHLAPSLVSFSCLRDLHVNDCDGLVSLFTSSTAKSLSSLENLTVRGCGSMQEILAKGAEESDEDSDITFGNLKNLKIRTLPSLHSFYTGTYHLKFPRLELVEAYNCSKMKVFSHADMSAPDNVTIRSSYGDLRDMLEKAFKKTT